MPEQRRDLAKPRPEDFETNPSGTHRILDQREVRIRELEAENRSLRMKLLCAEAAMQFTPEQISALKDLVGDINQVLHAEASRARGA